MRCEDGAMSWSVLVVDDDASFRHLATRTLRSWGFAVVGEAGTLAEAVDRATELRPDAALVDIGLPDGDGFELAQRFSALPWSVRVVLISSDSDAANEAVARRMGAAGFVPKDELLGSALRRLIGGE
jgi:DNA-binding NarL/FixJ family response regulator